MRAALIYPHQLFEDHPAVSGAQIVLLVEDPLFFGQYKFHAQKLVLHRASMSAYAERLERSGVRVRHVRADELEATGDVAAVLAELGVREVRVVDPSDDWLKRRLARACRAAGLALTWLDDPHFLTPPSVLNEYGRDRSSLYFTDFYIQQRKRLNVLVDGRGKPVGEQWSFDHDNRRKLPRDIALPAVRWPRTTVHVKTAREEIAKEFPTAYGSADDFSYPTTSAAARTWLNHFLDERLADFGAYEDAIHGDEPWLFHSVLTPMLNTGLLSPREVVDAALERESAVPLNSLEGFLRQVIGWREFVRLVYLRHGRRQRTSNFWDHRRAIPRAFYDGTTGIAPVDRVIGRVLKHAWCHHIERLMILGNFLLLCEIRPDDVYRYFMELFIDAYDWVMVPNVYGMSQHADGGLMTTKPYISGSSYVLKMSNFQRGDWCPIWDGLYWRFIDRHRDFFSANPRMSVMVKQCDRMGSKLTEHQRTAERFLESLG